MGTVLIAFDLMWIPFQAFSPDSSLGTEIISMFTTVFWTLDILFSFLCAFIKDGIANYGPKDIAMHYLRGWFFPDIAIAAVDWGINILSASMQGADSGLQFARTLRFLRLARLLRLLKASGIVADLLERIRSEFWHIIIGVVLRIIFILVMNHLIACMWYMLGTALMDLGYETWVESNSMAECSLLYRYSTSLHWSMTQFTPASMEVVPENSFERLFTVAVLIFAMVTFSSFISSITSATSKLQSLNSEQNAEVAILRKFLFESRVSPGLGSQVWSCVRFAHATYKTRIRQEDVAILSRLPLRVKADLWEEVWSPVVSHHPLFKQMSRKYNVIMRRIYQVALEEISLGIGRELFCWRSLPVFVLCSIGQLLVRISRKGGCVIKGKL